jgi:hypothetical protein
MTKASFEVCGALVYSEPVHLDMILRKSKRFRGSCDNRKLENFHETGFAFRLDYDRPCGSGIVLAASNGQRDSPPPPSTFRPARKSRFSRPPTAPLSSTRGSPPSMPD